MLTGRAPSAEVCVLGHFSCGPTVQSDLDPTISDRNTKRDAAEAPAGSPRTVAPGHSYETTRRSERLL